MKEDHTMTTLTQELHARVRNRAQRVGVHTALLELREAANAVVNGYDPGSARLLSDDDIDDEMEQAKEEAAAEAHAEGYAEGTADATLRPAMSFWDA
jgi:hypothetical protein